MTKASPEEEHATVDTNFLASLDQISAPSGGDEDMPAALMSPRSDRSTSASHESRWRKIRISVLLTAVYLASFALPYYYYYHPAENPGLEVGPVGDESLGVVRPVNLTGMNVTERIVALEAHVAELVARSKLGLLPAPVKGLGSIGKEEHEASDLGMLLLICLSVVVGVILLVGPRAEKFVRTFRRSGWRAVANGRPQLRRVPVVDRKDPIDKLRKLKVLLDEGVVTQEEFDRKKKLLLSQV